jgi:hypothetical protein
MKFLVYETDNGKEYIKVNDYNYAVNLARIIKHEEQTEVWGFFYLDKNEHKTIWL